MNLRSNHHMHFISAIKGDKVVKMLNVLHGRPTLSFKKIGSILDYPEPCGGSDVKIIPLVNRSFQKVAGLYMDSSDEETNSDVGDSSDGRSRSLEDIILGEMTLRQLKKKCKSRKGGVSRSTDKGVKQEYGVCCEEDGLDLEETIGSLKRKVSRKSKSRKMQKCGSGLKTTNVVKCEPVSSDEDALQVGGAINTCVTIKVEISAPDYSPSQDVSYSSDDSYSSEHAMFSTGKEDIGETQVTGESCIEEEDSLIKVPNAGPVSREHLTTVDSPPTELLICEEMMNIDDLGVTEKVASEFTDLDDDCLFREQSSLIAEEQVCSLNKISHKFNESLEGSCVPLESTKHDMGLAEKVESDFFGLDDGCSSREQPPLIAEEFKVCRLNQISYEIDNHLKGSCVAPEIYSHEEALKADDPEMVADQPIIVPILAREDEDINDALRCNESQDILFPIYYSPEPVESSSDEEACSKMHITKEYMLPGVPCMSVNSPNRVLNATTRCTRTVNHVSKAVSGDCSMPVMLLDVDSKDDTDKVSRSFASESIDMRHPPERIFSARKSISPDSQQKLCKAMKSLDLPNYQDIEKSKQGLCFEKQEVNADASSDVVSNEVSTSPAVPEQVNSADTSPNSEQKMRRGKEEKKRHHTKGVNKVSRPKWYRISSGCACMQTCPQNVVDFSQQQMNDVERLAAKLTKELGSMKDIMLEMLQPETRRLTTSRNNINKVRVAVENATRAEDHTRRLLDMMRKDCNRFCKIVSLAEKEAASVGNKPDNEEAENDAATTPPSRGRKKIKFADESGGMLCDVRFIKEQESSQLDSTVEEGVSNACIDPMIPIQGS